MRTTKGHVLFFTGIARKKETVQDAFRGPESLHDVVGEVTQSVAETLRIRGFRTRDVGLKRSGVSQPVHGACPTCRRDAR